MACLTCQVALSFFRRSCQPHHDMPGQRKANEAAQQPLPCPPETR